MNLKDVLDYKEDGVTPLDSFGSAVLYMVALANQELEADPMAKCRWSGRSHEIQVDFGNGRLVAVELDTDRNATFLGAISFQEFTDLLADILNTQRSSLKFAAQRLKYYLSQHFYSNNFEYTD